MGRRDNGVQIDYALMKPFAMVGRHESLEHVPQVPFPDSTGSPSGRASPARPPPWGAKPSPVSAPQSSCFRLRAGEASQPGLVAESPWAPAATRGGQTTTGATLEKLVEHAENPAATQGGGGGREGVSDVEEPPSIHLRAGEGGARTADPNRDEDGAVHARVHLGEPLEQRAKSTPLIEPARVGR